MKKQTNPQKPIMKRISRLKLLSLFLLLFLTLSFSCQVDDPLEETTVSKVQVRPLTDPKIRAEIISRVEANTLSTNGRTSSAPTLPSGYDYNNMQEVVIEGTSWVTYVAYSLTENTATSKKLIGIYYQNNQYKNYMYIDWADVSNDRRSAYSYKYYTPEVGVGVVGGCMLSCALL
jgi:hypothetical protein